MERKIIIVLGSNYEAERNIAYAKERLAHLFPNIRFSRNLQTAPIDMACSDLFINAVAEGTVSMSGDAPTKITNLLKQIERECGRKSVDKAANIVRLDLDLLLCGDEKFKLTDWEREYVGVLLDELAGKKY